jgi:hypothetical protein
MEFTFDFSDRTDMLPLLDGYIATELANSFSAALEIGVYKGGFLLTLVKNNPSLLTIGIDPYPNLLKIRESLIDYRDKLGLKDRLYLYLSFDELTQSKHNSVLFDMIHIDGLHSESQVNKDLMNVLPKLKEHSILIIDDIFYHSYPGVTAAAFSFIEHNNFTPFLFTEKKIYICNPNYYEEYYKKTISIFSRLKINYEENENLNSQIRYPQSNAIHGSNIIITSEMKQGDFLGTLKEMNLKLPLRIRIKSGLKNLLPPKLFELLQFSKAKLKQHKSFLAIRL